MAKYFVIRELGEDNIALELREKEAIATRQTMFRIYHQIAGIYGESFSESLGLMSNPPSDPTQLHQNSEEKLERVRRHSRKNDGIEDLLGKRRD